MHRYIRTQGEKSTEHTLTFWPTPGFKGEHVSALGYQQKGSLISATAAPHGRGHLEKERKEQINLCQTAQQFHSITGQRVSFTFSPGWGVCNTDSQLMRYTLLTDSKSPVIMFPVEDVIRQPNCQLSGLGQREDSTYIPRTSTNLHRTNLHQGCMCVSLKHHLGYRRQEGPTYTLTCTMCANLYIYTYICITHVYFITLKHCCHYGTGVFTCQ